MREGTGAQYERVRAVDLLLDAFHGAALVHFDRLGRLRVHFHLFVAEQVRLGQHEPASARGRGVKSGGQARALTFSTP